MKLEFEILESNDAHYAKRARVDGGHIYLFTDWDNERGRSLATAVCFVPDVLEVHQTVHLTDELRKRGQPVGLSADDLHSLSGGR